MEKDCHINIYKNSLKQKCTFVVAKFKEAYNFTVHNPGFSETSMFFSSLSSCVMLNTYSSHTSLLKGLYAIVHTTGVQKSKHYIKTCHFIYESV